LQSARGRYPPPAHCERPASSTDRQCPSKRFTPSVVTGSSAVLSRRLGRSQPVTSSNCGHVVGEECDHGAEVLVTHQASRTCQSWSPARRAAWTRAQPVWTTCSAAINANRSLSTPSLFRFRCVWSDPSSGQVPRFEVGWALLGRGLAPRWSWESLVWSSMTPRRPPRRSSPWRDWEDDADSVAESCRFRRTRSWVRR
jgi:hypothetical protein